MCSALKVHTHPLLQDIGGTVDYISMIVQFWKIVNVRSQYLDNRKRDPNRAVIRSADDDNLRNLLQISNVVDSIAHKTGVCIKTHLLSIDHEYVMLGISTTDYLKKQLGKLLQGSGGTYFITVQQNMESGY